MGTVLGILAVIGRILLVILWIVVALLLLILFVPFRYRVDADGNTADAENASSGDAAKAFHVRARVTWLLHLLSVEWVMNKGDPEKKEGTEMIFRIFGISPKLRKKEKAEKKKQKKKDQKKKELNEIKEKDPDEYERLKAEAEKRRKARAETRARAAEAEAKRRQAEEERRRAEDEELRRTEERREKLKLYAKQRLGRTRRVILAAFETLRMFGYLVLNGVISLSALPAILTEKLFAFFGKAAEAFGKASRAIGKLLDINDVLWDGRTHEAVRKVLLVLKKLLGHISPKKADGEVVFGLGDPYITGEVLAVLSAAYPLYGGKIRINPDFSESIFDGDVRLSGRLYIFYVVYLVLLLILDGNVRYVYKQYKEMKKSNDPAEEESSKEREPLNAAG